MASNVHRKATISYLNIWKVADERETLVDFVRDLFQISDKELTGRSRKSGLHTQTTDERLSELRDRED